MDVVYSVLGIEPEEGERLVGLVVKGLFDDEGRRELVALVYALALNEPVQMRAELHRLHDGRKDDVEKSPLLVGLRVFLFKIFVYGREVDAFANEGLVVCAVGVEVRGYIVHGVYIAEESTVPAVSASALDFSHVGFPLFRRICSYAVHTYRILILFAAFGNSLFIFVIF